MQANKETSSCSGYCHHQACLRWIALYCRLFQGPDLATRQRPNVVGRGTFALQLRRQHSIVAAVGLRVVVLEIVGSNALYRMASMSVRHPVTSLAVCPTATNMVVAGDSRHSILVFVSGVPAQGEGKKNGTSNSPAVLSVAGADVHSRPVTACLPVPRPGAGVPVRSAYQLSLPMQ